MAEKIMFASGKGGVGKSTICLSLAAGLAARGHKVLIMEADTGFRGLDVSLSVDDRAMYDLSDVLDGRCMLDEALLCHSRYGIELLCAPNDPEYLPEPRQLAALLEAANPNYDYILIDCGAGFGPMQGRISRLSDMAILVTVPDRVAVRGAAHTSQLLHQKGMHRQRLIINRIPKVLRTSATIRDLDDVIDLVGAQLLGAVPEGVVTGIPTSQNSRQPAQEELDRIAQRLTGKYSELVLY
ncbi:MAG: AAA family ATPase [Angelakisella sp.]